MQLGGRDYKADAQDKFGDTAMDGSVYQYYGAAKNLLKSSDQEDLV